VSHRIESPNRESSLAPHRALIIGQEIQFPELAFEDEE
jgi:hypothetical protein